MKKRGVLYLLLYAVVLMINMLIVLCQTSNIAISRFSLPALFLMIIMAIHALLSYLLRYKGNYLQFRRFGRPNPFATDKKYTFNELYIKRFFLC